MQFSKEDVAELKTLVLIYSLTKYVLENILRRHDTSAHRPAHLFITAISSHSHVRRKQLKRTLLQYSCSVTIINIVEKICERKFMN